MKMRDQTKIFFRGVSKINLKSNLKITHGSTIMRRGLENCPEKDKSQEEKKLGTIDMSVHACFAVKDSNI